MGGAHDRLGDMGREGDKFIWAPPAQDRRVMRGHRQRSQSSVQPEQLLSVVRSAKLAPAASWLSKIFSSLFLSHWAKKMQPVYLASFPDKPHKVPALREVKEEKGIICPFCHPYLLSLYYMLGTIIVAWDTAED